MLVNNIEPTVHEKLGGSGSGMLANSLHTFLVSVNLVYHLKKYV